MLVNGVLKSWNLIPILPLLQQLQKKLLLKNQNLLKNAKIKLKREDVRNGRSKRNVTKHSSRKNVKRLVKLAKLVKKWNDTRLFIINIPWLLFFLNENISREWAYNSWKVFSVWAKLLTLLTFMKSQC